MKIKNNVCHVLAINTLDEDIQIEIPHKKFYHFEYHNFPEEREYFDSDSEQKESPVSTDRVTDNVIYLDDIVVYAKNLEDHERKSDVYLRD